LDDPRDDFLVVSCSVASPVGLQDDLSGDLSAAQCLDDPPDGFLVVPHSAASPVDPLDDSRVA
jgi:hypothetical protein